MKFRIFILLIFGVFNVYSKLDNCTASRCGECISQRCAWCAQDIMVDNSRRCMPVNAIEPNWCDKNFIKNPQPKKEVIMDKQFTENIVINGAQSPVQFKPQQMRIKARPGDVTEFQMSYLPAKDYPLDVYYLMDISATMSEKKKELQKQAETLYKELTSYTNNVKLGIGSFVEKPGFPYVDKWKTINPHISYSFKNDMSLSEDWQKFERTINNLTFGANYDDPEAGLDALMQVMTCKDEIGWRENARHIIVLCTDSTYHSAGDGKMIGAIKPNDMKCHMHNHEHDETIALTYDYPSVSQINRVRADGRYIIIFAVTENVVPVYEALAKQIEGAQCADLDGKTSPVEIIKNAYKESANSVTLTHNVPNFMELTLDPNCNGKTKNKRCESTIVNKEVKINAALKINLCPTNGNNKYNLVINNVGIKDNLAITVDIDCKCDCEVTYSNVTSPRCHNAGVLQCGICSCNPGRYGVDCRCNGTSTDDIKDVEKCKMDPEDKDLCSGRGSCVCGKCEKCQPGFSGEYCQYDVNFCPRKCSNNGLCKRNRCECFSGWSGGDCSCTTLTDKCLAPHSKQLCSGNGECKCGTCHCNKLPGKNETYSGTYCDACDDCAERRCKELEDYVYCNFINTKLACDEQYNATNTEVYFLNKTEFNSIQSTKWCKKQLENGSYIVFKYQYKNDGDLELLIQNEAEHPPKANIFIAVGSAIGTVLLVGILTLIIWKILVDQFDKREYEKFKTDAQANGYDVSTTNPLYHPPAVNFSNPAFEH